jgi:hypothetical protein
MLTKIRNLLSDILSQYNLKGCALIWCMRRLGYHVKTLNTEPLQSLHRDSIGYQSMIMAEP